MPLPEAMAIGLANVVSLAGQDLGTFLPEQEIENMLARARHMLDRGEIAA